VREGEAVGREWLVLLEAAEGLGGSTIDGDGLRRLVGAWPAPAPAAFHGRGWYALQVAVAAGDPPGALAAAMALWVDALDRSGLPAWDLVRAEVVTPSQLESEIRDAEQAGDGGAGAGRRG
jgi:hypothetical protein